MTTDITMQIVIARADKTALIPTGRYIQRDLNWFPEFRADWEGKAAMWLRRGTLADVERAKQFAVTEGYTVFTFPRTEKDPLGKARAAVVQAMP